MLKLNNAEINTEIQESRPCWKIAQGALVKFGYEENLCQDMKHFFPIFHRYKIWNNYNVLRNDLKFKWLDTDLLYHLNLFKFLLISIFLFHLCITIYIYNAHYSTYRPGLKKKKRTSKTPKRVGRETLVSLHLKRRSNSWSHPIQFILPCPRPHNWLRRCTCWSHQSHQALPFAVIYLIHRFRKLTHLGLEGCYRQESEL